ncbi:MAG: 30S ribosome-binding factor RbfA [Thermaerobacter sp.]|nr:30S ribosome-binding factor RbfA [Thermaerobacter sp.]
MNQARADRVGQALQRELGAMLLTEIKDPRVGFVSVTRVDVARDLSLARIYVSVMGGPLAMKESLAGLRSASPFLRGEAGRRLGLRHAPQLDFRADTSIDDTLRLYEVMKKLPEVRDD